MHAMQVGRLTLRSSGEEVRAVEDAQRTYLSQLEWGLKTPGNNNDNDTILRRFWTRLHSTNDECICRQCLGMYVPTLSRTPTPPI